MDKKWAVSYLYLFYLFLATLPQLTNLPGFNLGLPILVLVALYLVHSYVTLHWRSIRFLMTAFVIGFLFEVIGVHTGFPFGRYYYTGGLGMEVLGVPVIIPLLWATLAYFSYLPSHNAVISSWLMVLVDLTVDPLFSRFDWHWLSPGQYFGVPITNFVSWFVISMIIYLLWKPERKTIYGIGDYDIRASGFVYGLILDLALQDYFSGLVYPALISTTVSTVTFLVLHELHTALRNPKSVSKHENN
ncbi:carotenoid biosynthesis protein [Metallosphaera tengchongensis]|uniref:Carotenoid biosynthesis protein n=1 Tax=Metallosphaera tengchongensis TaxID=1532350 RepID=A0A6N0NTC7_9CREN|nr:carotenoid biosynthesis protein [Metallosphaera tengchongensis]QKQ99098.1 carotenoid biosynthesis protein [Metallosphaera tengchongensis]